MAGAEMHAIFLAVENQSKDYGMSVKSLLLSGVVLGMLAAPAFAGVEETYNPDKPYAVTPWYGKAGAADLDFIAGMRPHHAGALTMSEEYLKDPQAENAGLKQLARGIIHNQTFEIGVLDNAESHIGQLADDGTGQIAANGQVQKEKFFRAPMPGPLDIFAGPTTVSARDVQFAKAMVIHHQAAVDMCGDYLENPEAHSGYLQQMCLDIIRDQKQEIGYMNGVVARYAGDPDAVKIDASMIHGMEGMKHTGMNHNDMNMDGHKAMPAHHKMQ
jgi:uncharacterized protein (DUF305 family)